jgi:uncharacterized protein (TIGR02246 family)
MCTRVRLILAIGFVALLPVAVMVAGGQPKSPAKAAEAEGDTDADRTAIRQSAREFNEAFAKGDAKAIAAFWTANGEYQDESGLELRGRDAIEKAFAELFKNQKPGKVEVDIHSIRFPSRDTAIEEGFLRHTPDGPGLPSSSVYRAVHVREDGKWKIAASHEWGAGQDRLGDLAFLIGKWEGGPKGQAMSLSFEKDGDNPFILGKFSRKSDGKVVAGGTIKIGLDAQRGQIRSWHFDNDGGNGQCLWLRDGNRWVLDAVGATTDGTDTAAVNLLSRLSADEIVWRSIDRAVGGEPLPDTAPVKLSRVK